MQTIHEPALVTFEDLQFPTTAPSFLVRGVFKKKKKRFSAELFTVKVATEKLLRLSESAITSTLLARLWNGSFCNWRLKVRGNDCVSIRLVSSQLRSVEVMFGICLAFVGTR